MTRQLTPTELLLLKKRDGKHNSIDEIINCESCSLLLDEDIE